MRSQSSTNLVERFDLAEEEKKKSAWMWWIFADGSKGGEPDTAEGLPAQEERSRVTQPGLLEEDLAPTVKLFFYPDPFTSSQSSTRVSFTSLTHQGTVR